MKDRNTTMLGIFTILAAVSSAGMAFFDGDAATNIDFASAIAAITAGIGLIKAADSKKSDAQ